MLATAVLLVACERKPDEARPAARPPALITVVAAQTGSIEVSLSTLGTLEALIDPRIGAEVAGRVLSVHARSGQRVRAGQLLARIDPVDSKIQTRIDAAEVGRLEALLAQQERNVARQTELVQRQFISRNALDDARAQRDALREQLAAARARVDASSRSVVKTQVLSPIDGFVETQIASPGDYVKVGDPLYQLVSDRKLRAHLPFPETEAGRLSRGMPARIRSPQSGGKALVGVVADIRPRIVEGSRALDVLVDLENDGSLRGGGTVNGTVIVETRDAVVLVPEQCVVLRPAGEVVYVVADGKANQRTVRTGVHQRGQIEIVSGLEAGEMIAADGAGFLSDGAAVQVGEPPAGKPATGSASRSAP